MWAILLVQHYCGTWMWATLLVQHYCSTVWMWATLLVQHYCSTVWMWATLLVQLTTAVQSGCGLPCWCSTTAVPGCGQPSWWSADVGTAACSASWQWPPPAAAPAAAAAASPPPSRPRRSRHLHARHTPCSRGWSRPLSRLQPTARAAGAIRIAGLQAGVEGASGVALVCRSSRGPAS
jgi:hypothetical protein